MALVEHHYRARQVAEITVALHDSRRRIIRVDYSILTNGQAYRRPGSSRLRATSTARGDSFRVSISLWNRLHHLVKWDVDFRGWKHVDRKK